MSNYQQTKNTNECQLYPNRSSSEGPKKPVISGSAQKTVFFVPRPDFPGSFLRPTFIVPGERGDRNINSAKFICEEETIP